MFCFRKKINYRQFHVWFPDYFMDFNTSLMDIAMEFHGRPIKSFILAEKVPLILELQRHCKQFQIQFIPMGGVSENNLNEWLQLKYVITMGEPWLAIRIIKELILKIKNY